WGDGDLASRSYRCRRFCRRSAAQSDARLGRRSPDERNHCSEAPGKRASQLHHLWLLSLWRACRKAPPTFRRPASCRPPHFNNIEHWPSDIASRHVRSAIASFLYSITTAGQSAIVTSAKVARLAMQSLVTIRSVARKEGTPWQSPSLSKKLIE